jgi:hypothetical protein
MKSSNTWIKQELNIWVALIPIVDINWRHVSYPEYIYHVNQIEINKKHVYHTKYCTKPISIQDDECGSVPEESMNLCWLVNWWSCDLPIVDFLNFIFSLNGIKRIVISLSTIGDHNIYL